MTKKDDEECGKKMIRDVAKSFPQYAEMIAEDDPGKI